MTRFIPDVTNDFVDNTPVPFWPYVAGGIWKGCSEASLYVAALALIFAFSSQDGNNPSGQVPLPSLIVPPAGVSMEGQ